MAARHDDYPTEESVAITEASVMAGMKEWQQGNNSNSEGQSALGFFEWMKHEPVAMIVIATVLSLAIQRFGLRLESLLIRPLMTKIAGTIDPDECVASLSSSTFGAASASSSASTSSSTTVPTASSFSNNSATSTPTATCNNSPQCRRFDSSKVEMYSNNVWLVIGITFGDLLLNFALVYLLYRLFVRGGLHPSYGASK